MFTAPRLSKNASAVPGSSCSVDFGSHALHPFMSTFTVPLLVTLPVSSRNPRLLPVVWIVPVLVSVEPAGTTRWAVPPHASPGFARSTVPALVMFPDSVKTASEGEQPTICRLRLTPAPTSSALACTDSPAIDTVYEPAGRQAFFVESGTPLDQSAALVQSPEPFTTTQDVSHVNDWPLIPPAGCTSRRRRRGNGFVVVLMLVVDAAELVVVVVELVAVLDGTVTVRLVDRRPESPPAGTRPRRSACATLPTVATSPKAGASAATTTPALATARMEPHSVGVQPKPGMRLHRLATFTPSPARGRRWTRGSAREDARRAPFRSRFQSINRDAVDAFGRLVVRVQKALEAR